MRIDGRSFEEIRKVTITPHFVKYAEGSCLVEYGNTKVICTASYEDKVPKWLQGSDKGWVGAEYSMLPRSTHTRVTRDKATNSGRSLEISRLIARSLRAITHLEKIKNVHIMVDCDVLQADGGTRTAAISGGFVALALAFQNLKSRNLISEIPLKQYVAAVSAGVLKDQVFLDLCYEEDSKIETDMNFVMCADGDFIEIQGTAEGTPFNAKQLNEMIRVTRNASHEIFKVQNQILQSIFPFQQ